MSEREYLRGLAYKYMEYALQDEMKEKEKLWYAHNDLKTMWTPVIVEIDTFLDEILPPLQCVSRYGREIEKYLQYYIVNYERIGDDKVIPAEYRVAMQIDMRLFHLDIGQEHAEAGKGLGFHTEPVITDLETQVYKLEKSDFLYNKEETEKHYAYAQEILGDIMPVVYENQSLRWALMPTKLVVDLMGMQDMYMAMYDCPEELHLLLRKITDDLKAYCFWQEKEGLLTWNGGNHFVGSGSYGFTNRLKKDSCRLKDMWGNMNSQESVGISPDMYREFLAGYYRELAELFGAVYYGCCEPANDAWDSIAAYPNLRKVSVSPWADQQKMGKELGERGIIFSRKPTPNFIGVPDSFDTEEFKAYMEETFQCAKHCHLEIIFRDVYSLWGDLEKPGKAVKIVKDLVKKYRE